MNEKNPGSIHSRICLKPFRPGRSVTSWLLPAVFLGGIMLLTACRNFELGNYDLDQHIVLPKDQLLGYADTAGIRSILQELPPGRRVDSLIYFANALRKFAPDIARVYARQAFELATEKNWPIPRGVSAYRLARLKGEGVQFDEDIEDAMVDARISRRLLGPYRNADWQFNLDELFGFLFRQAGEMDSARYFLKRALAGLDHLEIHKEALDLRKAAIYHNLANTYDPTDPVGPLTYFQKGDSLYQLANDRDSRANLWLAWGIYYSKQQKFRQADSLFTLCIEQARRTSNEKSLSLAYLYRGMCNSDQLTYYGQEKYFTAALEDLRPVSKFTLDDEYLVYNVLGNVYQAAWLWDIDESYADTAILYYKKAMQEAGKSGAIMAMNNLIQNLVALYTYDNGRHKAALNANLGEFLYQSYAGAVHTVTQQSKTAYQRINAVEQRDIEVNAANKRRRQLYSGMTIFLVASALFLLALQRQQNRRLKAEMSALRAQIDPHFISNSLNAIENLVNRGENQEASRYLIHFSRLARQVLSGSRAAVIPLSQELKTLKHFLELEQLRFRDKLTYEITVSPSIRIDEAQVPAMILQPYVENAILHGIKPRAEGGKVKVEVRQQDKLLVYVVEDNGIGRERSKALQKESAMQHRSVGMKITEDRIKNMGRVKGLPVEILDLRDETGQPAGTRVTIRLPYKFKNNTKT